MSSATCSETTALTPPAVDDAAFAIELFYRRQGYPEVLVDYLLTELEVKLPYQEKNRYLRFRVVMRTDEKSDFRTKGDEILLEAIKLRCESPASAFAALHKTTSEKEVFPEDAGGQGSYLLEIRIDLKPEEHYPVFPTSAP